MDKGENMTDQSQPERVEGSKSSFMARLFRGDVSLLITYWVFGFLVANVLFSLLLLAIDSNYLQIASSEYGYWYLMVVYALIIGYTIFILVAIWRSANKYTGNPLWSGLAQVSVVLGVLGMVGNLVIGLNQGFDSDSALREEIRLINNSLPSMIDDYTRLDHTSLQGRDIYYDYTLTRAEVENIDISNFTSAISAKLKTTQCTTSETRALLDEGRKLVYTYRDKSGSPVTKIVVENSDCM